jgi:hypothetical protein
LFIIDVVFLLSETEGIQVEMFMLNKENALEIEYRVRVSA